jgi:hypothetical protein
MRKRDAEVETARKVLGVTGDTDRKQVPAPSDDSPGPLIQTCAPTETPQHALGSIPRQACEPTSTSWPGRYGCGRRLRNVRRRFRGADPRG